MVEGVDRCLGLSPWICTGSQLHRAVDEAPKSLSPLNGLLSHSRANNATANRL
jgi:hypothetical protein